MKKSRKMLVVALATVMASSIGFISWKQVKADEQLYSVEDGSEIKYQEYSNMSDYWKGNVEENTAPVCPQSGYVFGGWYQDAQLTQPLEQATTTAYAKWVPDYVLSVKAQIEVNAEDGDMTDCNKAGYSYIRFISSVDDNTYQDYGFHVIINKKNDVSVFDTKYYLKGNKAISQGEELDGFDSSNFKLYKTLKKAKGDIVSYTPANVFGSASDYFFVAQQPSIKLDNADKTLYVRPFWVTPDGTEVEGLAKYVRVMDGYTANQYISVPVNIATAEKDIAAGVVTMTYPEGLTYAGVESGINLPGINVYNDATNRKLTFVAENSPISSDGSVSYVGNTFTDIDPTEYIYVNVWFTGSSDVNNDSAQLTFPITIEEGNFCNWHEEDVTVTSRGDYIY